MLPWASRARGEGPGHVQVQAEGKLLLKSDWWLQEKPDEASSLSPHSSENYKDISVLKVFSYVQSIHSSYLINHLWLIFANVFTHQSLSRLTVSLRVFRGKSPTYISIEHYKVYGTQCSSIFYENSTIKSGVLISLHLREIIKLFVLAISVRGFRITPERQRWGYQMTAAILLREFPVNWLLMSFVQKQLDISHARHKKLGIMPHWFSATIRSHYIFW